MKKAYLSYLLVGLITGFLTVAYLGSSNGFANYLPIGALLGAVLLFAIAAPMTLYYRRLSLYIGLIGIFLVLPYISIFTIQFLMEYKGTLHWSVLLILSPSIMLLTSLYLTIRLLIAKELVDIPSNKYLLALLASIPIIMFLLYLTLYGNEWSWEMFKV